MYMYMKSINSIFCQLAVSWIYQEESEWLGPVLLTTSAVVKMERDTTEKTLQIQFDIWCHLSVSQSKIKFYDSQKINEVYKWIILVNILIYLNLDNVFINVLH